MLHKQIVWVENHVFYPRQKEERENQEFHGLLSNNTKAAFVHPSYIIGKCVRTNATKSHDERIH